MLANHYFLAHQGYFDTEAVAKPLLHMWSLSVEEQFYLVAPLAIVTLFAATRGLSEPAARRAHRLVAGALAAASFIACVALTYGVDHNPAFYLMPTRGWEFILGGNVAVALPLLRSCSRRVLDLVAGAGVAAIAFAVVTFDAVPYPTFRAAVPAVGAAAIIACGLAMPGNIVARALATAPMVAIGLVSYAWYLWHWPLLSFLRTSSRFTDTGLREALAVATLALVLAALTYQLVERPIRAWRRDAKLRSLPVTATMVSACVMIGTVGYAWSGYALPPLLPQVTGLEPLAASQAPLPPITRRGLLLGDSHAGALRGPFLEYARRTGAELTAHVPAGCPPLIGVNVVDGYGVQEPICKNFLANIDTYIDWSQLDFAIIVVRWSFYLGLPPIDAFPKRELVSQAADNAEAPIAMMHRGLTALLAKARQAGVPRILLVGPIAEFSVHPPSCVMRAMRRRTDACSMSRSAVDARRAGAVAMLRKVAGEFANVRMLDPIAAFCDDSTCRPHLGPTLFYSDTSHLSPAGAERLFETYRSDFEWAFGGARGLAAQQDPASHPP